MRRLLWIVPFVLLTASCAIGQEASPSKTSPPADAQPAKVKVYTLGPGVTAPDLLASNLPPMPEVKCKKEEDRTAVFSAMIDTAGVPCNVHFSHGLYPNGFFDLAIDTVVKDRFKPGTYNGNPVVVAVDVELNLSLCWDKKNDASGNKLKQPWLLEQPKQRVFKPSYAPNEVVLSTGYVIPPLQINQVEPEFSEEARKAKFQGTVVIAIIVDVQGKPQNPRVIRAAGMGLDEKAIEAVKKYRFKPAMKDGRPVAVPINIEINFRLYDRPPN